MSRMLRLAVVAVAAMAIGVGLGPLLPSGNNVGSDPSPSPTPGAWRMALGWGALAAGTYVATPFARPGSHALCGAPPEPGCSETTADDAISFTFTVPDGWEGVATHLVNTYNEPPGGAAMYFSTGAWLFSDPCADADAPDIPVGPTVDDFVSALVDHPLLDVTAPADVTLAGYSGKYLELQGPADTTACPTFRAWAPNVYAQGPDQRWHLWVLDADGIRVVVRTDTYPGTSPEVQAELQEIVDSLQISVPAGPEASPTLAVRFPPYCFSGSWSYEQLEPARYDMSPDCPGVTAGWPDRRVSMFVPDGWILYGPGKSGGLHHSVVDARIKLGVVGNTTVDLCTAGASIPLGPTVDDLVAALAPEVTGVDVSVMDITLAGHDGQRVDLAIPTTPPDCQSHTVIETTPNGAGEAWGLESPPDKYHQIWILDVDGVRFLVDASFAADISPDVYAELEQIVQSIDFEP